jgi:hypothetical protein
MFLSCLYANFGVWYSLIYLVRKPVFNARISSRMTSTCLIMPHETISGFPNGFPPLVLHGSVVSRENAGLFSLICKLIATLNQWDDRDVLSSQSQREESTRNFPLGSLHISHSEVILRHHVVNNRQISTDSGRKRFYFNTLSKLLVL